MIYYYGSAFNPMTLAHQNIIKDLAKTFTNFNDILIIGVSTHEYKEYSYDAVTRYYMAYNFMSKNYNITFRWKVYYQFARTWEFFHKVFSEEEQKDICLIIGQDEYDSLKAGEWEHSEDILNTYQIKVIPRTDNISSSAVRELFNTEEIPEYDSVKHLISKEVYDTLIDQIEGLKTLKEEENIESENPDIE